MATPDHFDYVSIGSGEAGKILSWALGSQGKKCAVIEHKWIGGSCPNVACLPSKNVIYSAEVATGIHQAEKFGFKALIANAAAAKIDMTKVKERKTAMVDGLVEMHMGKFADAKVELIQGHGKLVGPKTIQIDGGRIITGDAVIICTGSKSVVDSRVPGLVESNPLTHVEILDLDTLPSHLIIVGSGYVGIEFAQAFRRFGSQVTVIGRSDQVLKSEDADIVSVLQDVLTREGVKFLNSAAVTKVSGTSGEEVIVTAKQGGQDIEIRGSHLLVAAGRTPNTSDSGLTEAGIKLTASGHVQVDEQLQTSVEGVFAVGDCAGSPHFTHVAFDDFRVVLANLTGKPRPGGTTGRQVPWTLFTHPEIAHCGLREKDAKAQGIKYRLAKLPMAAVLRTRTHGQMEGFAKALVEADGDKVLGFTAIGAGVGEMLPVVQLAMKLGLPYSELADLVITHPTVNEGITGLFGNVPPRA